MRTRILRLALAVATAMSVRTAIVAAQLIGSEPSSASSAAGSTPSTGAAAIRSSPSPRRPPMGSTTSKGSFSRRLLSHLGALAWGEDLHMYPQRRRRRGAEPLAHPTFGTGWAFSYGMAVVENSNSSPTQWTVFQENGSPAGFSSCPTTKSGSCTNASGQADVSLSFNLVNNVPSYTFTHARSDLHLRPGAEQAGLRTDQDHRPRRVLDHRELDRVGTQCRVGVRRAATAECDRRRRALYHFRLQLGRNISSATDPWVGSPPTATTPPAPATSWSRSPSPTAR